MKKRTTLASLSFTFVFTICAFTLSVADEFKVDTSRSAIAWTGQNVVGGKHTGTIRLSKGNLTLEDDRLTAGNFTADIGSISVTDLAGDRAARLANHLKSDDFFDAVKFPEATFSITAVEGTGSEVTVTGNLTIKGIKQAISFPASVHYEGNTVHATAKGIKIDRTQFDIKYRSGNFFSGLGDKAISDEFQLDIEILATK